MRFSTFWGYVLLTGGWLLNGMEPTTNRVIRSLKDMCVYHACTSEKFLEEFLSDKDYLVNMNMTQPHHESAQRVIQHAGISHQLAHAIRLLEWTTKKHEQPINPAILDIEALLARKTIFISPDQSRKAVAQLHHPYPLKEFSRTLDGRWKPIATYQGHTKDVTDAAWSPNNQLLATFSSFEKKMIIWNTITQKPLYFTGHPHQILYAGSGHYWRDNATVVYPATNQNIFFHIPWMQTTLNDALALKALMKKHLTLDEKRACVQRIENDLIQKDMNRMIEREHQKQQYTQHKRND